MVFRGAFKVKKKNKVKESNKKKKNNINITLYYSSQLLLFGLQSLCHHGGAGLMVSALTSGLRSLGLSPGPDHCVVFLGRTMYSHSASLYLGV